MFALINTNGIVVQIEPEIFPVAAPLEWIDITGTIPRPAFGWLWNGSVFVAPTPAKTPQTDAEQAEERLRGDKVFLALMREIKDDDTLTIEQAAIALRSRLS